MFQKSRSNIAWHTDVKTTPIQCRFFGLRSSMLMIVSSRWDLTVSSQRWAQVACQWYHSGW
jgi:hypothetical protein